MNSHAHTYVTPLKTPLKRIQIPQAMETTRTIINIILYVTILALLVMPLLSTLISDAHQLRTWAQGEEGEGDPQDPQK